MTVGVVDYEAGNLRSVETALRYLDVDYRIGKTPPEIGETDKLVFPGVGDARAAMGVLRDRGLDSYIVDFARSGKAVLGICLGSQIVLEASEENDAECLGLIPGQTRRFSRDAGLKVPQIGWNSVARVASSPLFAGIPEEASFYFVHSYYPDPTEAEAVIGTTDYGVGFASAIAKDNVWAVQFHPEKSGRWGLQLLRNFLERCE